MATVKLDLVKNVWQEVGAFGFVCDKSAGGVVLLVNADALPTGVQDTAMSLDVAELQFVPAPANGSWYVATPYDSDEFKYTEV